jgi:hypothetical protein
MPRVASLLLSIAGFAGLVFPVSAETATAAARFDGGPDDVVVVAVVDFNFSPYHWDFLASRMPQHLDNQPGNDLPLDKPPHTWLPGFPNPKKAFASYNRFDLSLDERNDKAAIAALDAKDAAEWAKVKPSTEDDINYYWFPSTKFIGAIEFGSQQLHGNTNDHGVGVTSVSVGNLHGTCPECLMVFLNIDDGDEASALRWAMAQPWIDVVSNSYGRGYAKVYNGPGVEEGLAASERGQTVFFSAGNGIENAYTVTNNTYYSSEKGPDWILTVGAVSPGGENYYGSTHTSENASYIGAGKPVDVAGIGLDYPSAYGAALVGETGSSGFSGTSNASPTIAGTYARALYIARRDLAGPSRLQRNSVIAKGAPYRCGSARPKCELRDGRLTAMELRRRLLHGAIHTPAGMTSYAGGELPPIGEDEFLNEGHGTFFARESGKVKSWLKEFDRIIAPMEGRAGTLERPVGERDWMIVDSWCRQNLWGAWSSGYYKFDKTTLPPPDPAWPVRTSLLESCEFLTPPP